MRTQTVTFNHVSYSQKFRSSPPPPPHFPVIYRYHVQYILLLSLRFFYVVPPSIAIHPCNVSARIGARVTFTVRAHAECFPRPHYQWYKREGGRWYIINNENSCQLVRRVAGLEDQNVSYSCKVYSPDDKSLYETSHEACIIIGKV